MLEIHPTLLLYQGVIFVAFAFLMWKFVYKNLVRMVEDRRRRIEENILDAERKRGEADALRLGLESRVSELNVRADQIVRDAEIEGMRRRDEILERARTEAARLAERSRLQCESELAEAMLAARTELLDIAGGLASRALGRAATPEVEERLIRELSEEIRKTEWRS
jgi:F-type H+-transporting ATPase subunit b